MQRIACGEELLCPDAAGTAANESAAARATINALIFLIFPPTT